MEFSIFLQINFMTGDFIFTTVFQNIVFFLNKKVNI